MQQSYFSTVTFNPHIVKQEEKEDRKELKNNLKF